MIKPWKLLSEELYPGLNYRKIAKRIYELPNGQQHIFDIILNREVSIAIAITAGNKIVIAEQYRPGLDKVLMELPAGVVDEGETPEQAVRRELLEETGYAGDFEYVGPAYRDAYATVVLHTFVVKNAHKIQDPHLEPDEFIETKELTIEEFRTHLRSGQLTDVAPGYLALDYLNLL
jgi:ADP-ribose pyrophosphatase